MNKENAIEVRDLKKKFKIYFDKGHMLKERIIFANRNKHEDRWVLNGISFDVKKGEAIGLIGKNGCGKSTTLKLLNRIIYPNGGSIEIEGKVSSLIELGAGFHEDMTGRLIWKQLWSVCRSRCLAVKRSKPPCRNRYNGNYVYRRHHKRQRKRRFCLHG